MYLMRVMVDRWKRGQANPVRSLSDHAIKDAARDRRCLHLPAPAHDARSGQYVNRVRERAGSILFDAHRRHCARGIFLPIKKQMEERHPGRRHPIWMAADKAHSSHAIHGRHKELSVGSASRRPSLWLTLRSSDISMHCPTVHLITL